MHKNSYLYANEVNNVLKVDGDDKDLHELRHFLNQLYKNSPSALEILFAEDENIIYINDIFRKLVYDIRKEFLSQLVVNSYGKYNISQIRKAKNKNTKQHHKKKDFTRKHISEFIDITYVTSTGYPFKTSFLEFIEDHKLDADLFAISNSDSVRNVGKNYEVSYSIFYDFYTHYQRRNSWKRFLYKKNPPFTGIYAENSNDLRKTNISQMQKAKNLVGIITYHQEEYSAHCKEYREYAEFMEKHNKDRWVNLDSNKDAYEGKNLHHSVRCSDTFEYIMLNSDMQVKALNYDFVMSIKRGEVELQDVVNYVENKFTDEYIAKLISETKLPKLPTPDRKALETDLRVIIG